MRLLAASIGAESPGLVLTAAMRADILGQATRLAAAMGAKRTRTCHHRVRLLASSICAESPGLVLFAAMRAEMFG